jgi:hypothetical protein
MKIEGRFKGRVIAIEGSKIIIDCKPEPRYYYDPVTKEKRFIASAFPDPDFPRIGAVVRGIFRKKDARE